ncbi:hypothetical protein TNCV_1798001 [Trichonephila clavipes]|nr:hypothetical protein TNCV_1798001 [Trichonephila clavipes]
MYRSPTDALGSNSLRACNESVTLATRPPRSQTRVLLGTKCSETHDWCYPSTAGLQRHWTRTHYIPATSLLLWPLGYRARKLGFYQEPCILNLCYFNGFQSSCL